MTKKCICAEYAAITARLHPDCPEHSDAAYREREKALAVPYSERPVVKRLPEPGDEASLQYKYGSRCTGADLDGYRCPDNREPTFLLCRKHLDEPTES